VVDAANAAQFRLACHLCHWLPDTDLSMGVVQAHFDTEHDGAEVELDMVTLCPRDGATLVRSNTIDMATYLLLVYDCPTCNRVYRVHQQKRKEGGGND
jgi:hypothetical protein